MVVSYGRYSQPADKSALFAVGLWLYVKDIGEMALRHVLAPFFFLSSLSVFMMPKTSLLAFSNSFQIKQSLDFLDGCHQLG